MIDKMKANMIFPDFVNMINIYDYFLNTINNHPEIIDNRFILKAIFGCFPNAIWNGGGHFFDPNHFFLQEEVERYINFYNSNGIPIRYTFTNPVLEEHMYYDTYCNMLARAGHNGFNEILTSDPKLEEYLREKYPNYKYVKSIIGTKDQDIFLDDKYYMSVLKRKRNNDWNFLDTIPLEKRSKVELLCTDPCPTNCPRIYEHYKEHGKHQISYYSFNKDQSECTMQDIKGCFEEKYSKTLRVHIEKEMILKDYLPKGFTNFKISGRFNYGTVIEELVNYFILPEYQKDIRINLINSLVGVL